DEERFIATSTAIPPTNTPKPEATRRPTDVPTAEGTGNNSSGNSVSIGQDDAIAEATATAVISSTGNGGSIDADNSAQDVSYSFYTDVDVDLLVVVDNNIVWNTTLYAGQSTGYLTGKAFVVSLTGADSIIVIDGSSNAETINATEFTLP
ncbi:MAG TPA: hypothetical protein PK819_06720, partial [Thermomicrobiales bacterium]|nr:hypothetical protein [Thermomicrobiales bacterium]